MEIRGGTGKGVAAPSKVGAERVKIANEKAIAKGVRGRLKGMAFFKVPSAVIEGRETFCDGGKVTLTKAAA